MEKLTKKQEEIICELLHCSYNKEITQFILETIGEDNWNRNILSDCMESFLTEKQIETFNSFGGGFTLEEVKEDMINASIEQHISDILEKNGVTKYLYENDEYLDAIRKEEIVCEGININEIKKMIYG